MAKLGRIAAFGASGLLAGVGQGLVKAGEEKRERALREMEMRFRADEAQKGREFQAGESALGRDFQAEQAGLGREFQAGESALGRGFQAEEAERGRGFTAGQNALDREQSGLLAGKEFTDKDGKVWVLGPGGVAKPVLDPEGNQLTGTPPRSATSDPLVKIKDEQGNPVWMPRSEAAGMEAYVDDDDATAPTPEERAVKLREQAQEMAEAEAYERDPTGPNFLRDDAVIKEAYDGLTPEVWIERRTREIEAELRGGSAPAPDETGTAEAGAPPAAGEPEQTAGQPPGAGTRENPYKATEQSQIDWFKANAPAGAVIEIDGKPYTK